MWRAFPSPWFVHRRGSASSLKPGPSPCKWLLVEVPRDSKQLGFFPSWLEEKKCYRQLSSPPSPGKARPSAVTSKMRRGIQGLGKTSGWGSSHIYGPFVSHTGSVPVVDTKTQWLLLLQKVFVCVEFQRELTCHIVIHGNDKPLGKAHSFCSSMADWLIHSTSTYSILVKYWILS